MEVVMHRFVLAEFNTHRAFSRNSASSRAIPIKKRIAQVEEDPALPIEWGKNQAGMQADEILSATSAEIAEVAWLNAARTTIRMVEALDVVNVHKQVANRLLEPFLWHTVIVSSTEWNNFFEQRCSPLAQPEIRMVAEAMQSALYESTPQYVQRDNWHLPYLQDDEREEQDLFTQKRLSIARCARVSYLTHEGKRDHGADISLYERLIDADPIHASPLEHVATPLEGSKSPGGNFQGWEQFRQQAERVR